MNTFRIVVVFFIGITSSLSYAQNGIGELPSIILSILDSDSESNIDDVDSLLELRANQSRGVNVQTGEIFSTTTISYDSSGRVERQVQQLLSDGEADGQVISTFEYDVLGRAESSISTTFNALGEQTSTLNGNFRYLPFEENLSQVVFISSGEGGDSTLVQNFEYETLSRISKVDTTLTSVLTGVITVEAIPTYANGRINSIVQTFTPGNTVVTKSLGYSATEHISTSIERGSSIEQVSLSFSPTTQVISSTLSVSTDTTQYENGNCDASNEANRRLVGLFALTTSSGGLGRQCRNTP